MFFSTWWAESGCSSLQATSPSRPRARQACTIAPRLPPPCILQCAVDRLFRSIGGRPGTESAGNGVEDLPDEASTALLHDAARLLVDEPLIDVVISRARAGECVVAGLPVVDTVKGTDAS